MYYQLDSSRLPRGESTYVWAVVGRVYNMILLDELNVLSYRPLNKIIFSVTLFLWNFVQSSLITV
jgi:hypothetical protein